MKNFLQRCLPVVCLPLVLGACEGSQPTVAYYLEHPRFLEKQIQICMSKTEEESMTMHCKTVIDAHGLLRIYLQSEQADPEQFGQRILNTEIDLADLKEKLDGSQSQASQEMKKTYEDKQQELRILLAVAGLNSPE